LRHSASRDGEQRGRQNRNPEFHGVPSLGDHSIYAAAKAFHQQVVEDRRRARPALRAVPQATTPRGLQDLIDADLRRYGRIIKEQGLKAE
jgi:hypothetical protein